MANRSLSSGLTSYVSRLTYHVSRHPHFALILIVFLTFRLMLPFVFRNGSYFVEAAPDLGDYLRWGTLADSHLYPFVDYWSEYPPLFPWSVIGLYRISALLPAWRLDQRLWFAVVLQSAMALFDAGNLILVYTLARQLGSKARAIRTAALFAGAFITAYAASGWYEPAPLFFLLLALQLALRDRFGWSALAAGFGFMIKIFPILIVPTALRRLTPLRRQVGYLIVVTATILGLMLPFLIMRPDFVLAFVRSTLNRPTWLSIWALLDGNYLFGVALPIVDRFSADIVGSPPVSQLPWPLIHVAFLGVFLFVYSRRIDWRRPLAPVALAGLTINLFLLWSKGFSGQFIVYAFPFVMLVMPNLRGVLYTALLSVLWVAEWPIAFQPLEDQNWFIAWIVIARTVVLIALSLEYFQEMCDSRILHPAPRFAFHASRVAAAMLLIGWISVGPVSVLSVHAYTQARFVADPAAPAINLIRAGGDAEKPIVLASPRIFRRLYPFARSVGNAVLLPVAKHTPEEARESWLNEIAAHGPFWFIADEGDPETQEDNRQAEAWVSDRACKVESTVAGSARVSRFVGAPTATPAKVSATFADEIELVGYRLSEGTLRAGGMLCVELNWQAIQTPSGDYTVFVHLIDVQGRLVAQNDQQPQGGFAPVSAWPIGSTIADKHGMILPTDLPIGEYVVRIGLYRSDDQTPVRATRGERLLPDAIGIVLTNVSVVP